MTKLKQRLLNIEDKLEAAQDHLEEGNVVAADRLVQEALDEMDNAKVDVRFLSDTLEGARMELEADQDG